MSLETDAARLANAYPRGTAEPARADEPVGDDARAVDAQVSIPRANADGPNDQLALHVDEQFSIPRANADGPNDQLALHVDEQSRTEPVV